MAKTASTTKTSRAKRLPVPEITTFPNAVRYLYEQTNVEHMRMARIDRNVFKVDRMRKLLDAIGNPHEQVRMIHVAGTVGKGSYDSMVCIFGCCEDKDVRRMLEKLALGGDKIIFTRAKGNPRAADPGELMRQFSDISGKMTQPARSLPEAIQLASRAVGRDDLICVTGSFYLVGETKKYLQELGKKKS